MGRRNHYLVAIGIGIAILLVLASIAWYLATAPEPEPVPVVTLSQPVIAADNVTIDVVVTVGGPLDRFSAVLWKGTEVAGALTSLPGISASVTFLDTDGLGMMSSGDRFRVDAITPGAYGLELSWRSVSMAMRNWTIPVPVEYAYVDGSGVVFPMAAEWAGEFNDPTRRVLVAFSGTGGGFQKFCRGDIDLSTASRPIRPSEQDLCAANGISGIVEFKVAYDGVGVYVQAANAWAFSLTVRELCRIWTANTSATACGGAGPQVNRWIELNVTWPDQPIQLFAPGTDTGTFDHFVGTVLTPFGAEPRSDFFPSNDLNIIVQGIANDAYSLGYVGSVYGSSSNLVRALAIDDENDANGAGPIAPSKQTIRDGTYQPLSRPVFVYGYTSAPASFAQSLARDIVKDFLRFGYSGRGQDLVGQVGYVTLSAAEVAGEVSKIPS